MASFNKQSGLSLLGTLIAVIVLAVVIIAASRLTARTQQAGRISRESFAAATVAREGLELVRAMRDTNWFLKRSDGRHWTHGLCSNPATGEVASERQFTLDPVTVRRLDPVGDIENALLTISDHGEWTHDPTGQPTMFSRVLSVDCQDLDVGIIVTSTVTWTSSTNQARELILRERLYDWFQ